MKLEKAKLSDLHPAEKNVRVHPEKQIKEMIRSVNMFGQIRPLIVDENNVVLAGNGLYEALSEMGRTEVDIYRVTGMSESDKKRLMLADNKIYALGADNHDAMMEVLGELKDELNIPGFDDDLLGDLLADMDGIEEQIADFGKVDEEEMEEFHRAAERKKEAIERAERVETPEPVEEGTQPTPSPAENGYTPAPDPAPADVERAITCPHCGGKIKL